MASKFIGQYKLEKSENFDAFMEAIGVNLALRTIGNQTTPQINMEHIEGDHFKIKEWTTLKSHTWDFTLGKEFQDKTVDGRNVMTTITIDGENLVITEKPTDDSGKTVTFTWELTADQAIRGIAKVGDVVATRIYKRLDS